MIKRAGRQDSLERRAGLLGYAPAGHVINGDKQLQPSQAQVFEAQTCDESHRRGSDALACLACPHPVADVRRAASTYLVQTNPARNAAESVRMMAKSYHLPVCHA